MLKIFLICLFVIGCSHTDYNDSYGYPAATPGKYIANDCVRFNEKEMKKQGKRTDGTPMKIIGYRRSTDGQLKYLVSIHHKRIDRPVEFTAVIKVFDRDTDKIECPK